MENKIVWFLAYDTEKITLDVIKGWCDIIFQCFEPEKMICDGKTSLYSKESVDEYLENNLNNDQLSMSFIKDKNSFYLVKNDIEFRTVSFMVTLVREERTTLLDQIMDEYMVKGGIVAYKCTSEDEFWQDADQIFYYKAKKRSLQGLKFTTSKIGVPETIVDVEYNPGHSHRYEGVWFGSCYEMWFGRPYYEFISKEKLQSFQNCYENVELGNDAVRITLYEDIWDFDNPVNRERQWDFRKSMGIDEVAHTLLKQPKKYRKPIDPQVEFEDKTENGVEYHWVINYADKNNKPIEKSKAAKKVIYVFVQGNNEPIDSFEEPM